MKYLSVTFVCQMQSAGSFPRYKGSMLRGVLGGSLRRAVCMTRQNECTSCMLVKTCVFPRLFTAASAPEGGGTAPLLPPPFCLEPPLDGQGEYAEGDSFRFTLKLFSFAVDYLPYFIHAFTLAGQHGMGRGAEHRQGLFRITDVLHHGVPVYDAAAGQLRPITAEDLPLPAMRERGEDSPLVLEFLTPLRFKQSNRLATDLDFSQLFRLIIRRLKSLYALDGAVFSLPQDDFSALMDAAHAMRITENALHWQDWSRYSGRQQTAMQMGGLVGRIQYQGPAAVFLDYLQLAALAHIGKQTSFGLGALNFSADCAQA